MAASAPISATRSRKSRSRSALSRLLTGKSAGRPGRNSRQALTMLSGVILLLRVRASNSWHVRPITCRQGISQFVLGNRLQKALAKRHSAGHGPTGRGYRPEMLGRPTVVKASEDGVDAGQRQIRRTGAVVAKIEACLAVMAQGRYIARNQHTIAVTKALGYNALGQTSGSVDLRRFNLEKGRLLLGIRVVHTALLYSCACM